MARQEAFDPGTGKIAIGVDTYNDPVQGRLIFIFWVDSSTRKVWTTYYDTFWDYVSIDEDITAPDPGSLYPFAGFGWKARVDESGERFYLRADLGSDKNKLYLSRRGETDFDDVVIHTLPSGLKFRLVDFIVEDDSILWVADVEDASDWTSHGDIYFGKVEKDPCSVCGELHTVIAGHPRVTNDLGDKTVTLQPGIVAGREYVFLGYMKCDPDNANTFYGNSLYLGKLHKVDLESAGLESVFGVMV